MTTTSRNGWTTSGLAKVSFSDVHEDPAAALVLIYSRLHGRLPAATALHKATLRIGREDDNDLPIPEGAVSRHHARVEQRGDAWWIIDLASTNGTIVNGVRVQEHRLVRHDVVRVGDTIYRYSPTGATQYGAYRIDGRVVDATRPFSHGLRGRRLVGGFVIDALLHRLEKVSRTELAIVVTGESGTGKELVAKELHQSSGRRGPFQAINCAALAANLIESELFGYVRGAFTGARTDKTGLIRAAQGGTLFLDEIGDMPLEAQAKLLRVLQEKEVLPIGATSPIPVDIRVVCATHRDLDAFVGEGRFRGDLLARLREFEIALPPLRERLEDLHPLVLHFLAQAGHPRAVVGFPYMLALSHYGWPYNVRELESAVKLSIALADGEDLDARHLPPGVRQALSGHGQRVDRSTEPPTSHNVSAPDAARPGTPSETQLRASLLHHGGNIAAVGRDFGKERMQVHRWLKRYGIDPNQYR